MILVKYILPFLLSVPFVIVNSIVPVRAGFSFLSKVYFFKLLSHSFWFQTAYCLLKKLFCGPCKRCMYLFLPFQHPRILVQYLLKSWRVLLDIKLTIILTDMWFVMINSTLLGTVSYLTISVHHWIPLTVMILALDWVEYCSFQSKFRSCGLLTERPQRVWIIWSW